MNDTMRNGLLWISIATGIILILVGSMAELPPLSKSLTSKDETTLGYVHGVPVSKSLYRTIKGEEADATDPQKVERFLSEQILIENALEQGVISRDPVLREAVLEVMREFVVSEQKIVKPTDQQLRELYALTVADYTPPVRYQVRTLQISNDDLAPDPVFEGENTSRFLPLGILRRSLGNDVVEQILTMESGDVVSLERENGAVFVKLDGIRRNDAPAFETIRNRVEEAWYIQEEEKAFDAYLKSLFSQSQAQNIQE
ncbi:peptidylprolyl isomerase [Kordiimonas sp. SCSIO 12610]|uniref:peptidylprolyl isomerase n=1 Tax=Kordiimonas sp. SCSIO 12610 TaxID=2829597 RepID=UPI00210A653D|nr:peptidylprolyl isomerase [Kordiimonas sp. SCSIO 12610]UTW55773.1 peptidyl-prolyl cis-trans isomerase [Kordiimonas sp. SCSIO 12610]